jgi:hypothetical protein
MENKMKMELQTAIEIMEYHQQWRLGKREDMIYEPKKLTEALDVLLSEVKKINLGTVMSLNCTCKNAEDHLRNTARVLCLDDLDDYIDSVSKWGLLNEIVTQRLK